MKALKSLGNRAFALSSALLVSSLLPLPVLSAPAFQVSLKFPVVNRGAPRTTSGGGTRGQCVARNDLPLFNALMPTRSNEGTTVSANPTLFWHVPENTAEFAEFLLFDERGAQVYSQKLAVAGTSRIVQLNLPSQVSLQAGKTYNWDLSLVCKRSDRGADRYITGQIQRIALSPTLQSRLATARTPLDQARVYANAGVWHETLTLAAQLRNSQPREWEELLRSVGLEKVAQRPIVNASR